MLAFLPTEGRRLVNEDFSAPTPAVHRRSFLRNGKMFAQLAVHLFIEQFGPEPLVLGPDACQCLILSNNEIRRTESLWHAVGAHAGVSAFWSLRFICFLKIWS